MISLNSGKSDWLTGNAVVRGAKEGAYIRERSIRKQARMVYVDTEVRGLAWMF